MDGPGRPKKFNIDEAYRLLTRSHPPVWTAADIGEELGVAGSTVRENIDELLQYPGVRSHEVGRATVYYHEQAQMQEDLDVTTSSSGGDLTPEERLAQARGRWEWATARATEGRRKKPLRSRAFLYEHLVKTVRALDNETISIDYSTLLDSDEASEAHLDDDMLAPIRADEWPLPHEEIKYYLTEIPLLATAGVGEVEGFARIAVDPIAEPLSNEYGATYVDDATTEELDRELPSLGDVMEAGELWNEFIGRMMEWRW
jgi:hypothetical protein